MLAYDDIILLDNLMYLGKGETDTNSTDINNYLSGYGAEEYNDKTIGEWLSDIDLELLEDNKYYGACDYITGKDWKNIINAALRNDNLRNLKIATTHTDILDDKNGGFSALFVDSKREEAVVAFRGTAGENEWLDNFKGGNSAETPAQRNALDWYKDVYKTYNLDKYGTITLTGHSKGGNKSKYIAIMDDTVSRCIALDGQGFSDKFFLQNSYQVAKNQNKIHNLCIDYDYVNLLLSDVGDKQYFVKQEIGEGGFLENHCPNTFLKFDDKGDYCLEVNTKGQAPALKEADKFFNGFLRSLSEDERDKTLEMMHRIMQCLFKAGEESGIITITKVLMLMTIPKYIENSSRFLAYLIKYTQVHPDFIDKFTVLFDAFDMNSAKLISGCLRMFIDFEKKSQIDFTSSILGYLEIWSWFGTSELKRITEAIKNLVSLIDKRIHTIDINENGNDIWIGPLMPSVTHTSMSLSEPMVENDQEGFSKSCCFHADLKAMRSEADNLLKYSEKYSQIVSQLEGYTHGLALSCSESETICQSLASIAAGMAKKNEILNWMGHSLHLVVNKYEETEKMVLERAQMMYTSRPEVNVLKSVSIIEKV